MLCKPPFAVEIVKGDRVLSLNCVFPGSEMEAMGEAEEKYGMYLR